MPRFELIVGTHAIPDPQAIDDLHHAGPDEPVPLSLAPYLPEISLAWSEKTLRNAISRGDLRGEMIGRRLYTTRRGIAAWRDRAAVVPKVSEATPEFQRDAAKFANSRAAAMSALAALKGAR